jgi:elongator complex protein 2
LFQAAQTKPLFAGSELLMGFFLSSLPFSSTHKTPQKKKKKKEYVKTDVLEGHKDSVTDISTLVLADGSAILAATSADCTVSLWKRKPSTGTSPPPSESIIAVVTHIFFLILTGCEENGVEQKWEMIQNINFAPKMMETVAFCILEETNTLLLAIGGVDSLVHLFIEVNSKVMAFFFSFLLPFFFLCSLESQFLKLLSLKGHEDWIRSIDFCHCDDGSVLMATSSQDTKVRLWKLAKLDEKSAENSVLSTSVRKIPLSISLSPSLFFFFVSC